MKKFMRLCTIILIVSLVFSMNATVLAGTDQPVTNCTTGNTYATIQAAIDQASAGEVIEVAAGSYNETLTINQSLTLQGAAGATVEISGTIEITASPVTLQNLKVSYTGNGASPTSVVRINGSQGQRLTLKDCTVNQNGITHGLWIYPAQTAVTLDHTTVTADNGAYPNTAQAITIHPNAKGMTLNLLNGSHVSGRLYYGIISWAENATFNITNSSVTAWGAIYLKNMAGTGSADHTVVHLTHADITGECHHNYGDSNFFGAIVLEGVSGCQIDVDQDSTVCAVGNQNGQSVVSFNDNAAANTMSVQGTLSIANSELSNQYFSNYGIEDGNQIALSQSARLTQTSGSAVVVTEADGTVTNVYTDLPTAVERARTGDTLALQGNCVLTDELVIDQKITITGGKTGGISGSVRIAAEGVAIHDCDLSQAAVTVQQGMNDVDLTQNYWGSSTPPEDADVYPLYPDLTMDSPILKQQPAMSIQPVPEKTIGDPAFDLQVTGGEPSIATQFTSSNPSVATVDANGKVTIIGTGTTVITAVKPSAGIYQQASTQCVVTVKGNAQQTIQQVPQTGETNSTGLCTGLCVTAGMALLGTWLFKRKSCKE